MKTVRSPENLPLVRSGRTHSTIVLGHRASPFDRWVAAELQRYIRRLSGAEPPVVTTAETAPTAGLRLLVGTPETNELTAAAQQQNLVDFSGLSPEGYLLKSLSLDGMPAVVIGGGSETGTMYAAYELIESLGAVFQLTGDVMPEPQPDLVLEPLDVRREPVLKFRGLHVRHFVMPEMGLAEFQQLLDQLAKLKCNYLEFYWYVGSPWIRYEHRGEPKLIGDLNPLESGYTCWRIAVGRFTPRDVVIGRDRFAGPRACAPEFQQCQNPDGAYRAAADMLRGIIAHAHRRKIQVWLGKGDCPCVPPNLGRLARYSRWQWAMGRAVSPGDPSGPEIWRAALTSMIETYPEADGYWLWLAENYIHSQDQAAKEIVRQYANIRPLIPRLDDLRAMGYDQYFRTMNEETQVESDLGLLHYANTVVPRLRQEHPNARLGVSVLGRSYLFPALDALLPAEVPLQSMESAVCWNRSARVPMENFAKVHPGRLTFLVPRLDDDESELAMQFNLRTYDHDRVVASSAQFGLAGLAPQSGRTRGLEHNFRFLADGGWDAALVPDRFYERYVVRLFGAAAREPVRQAYNRLEELEHFLGFGVDVQEAGHCFQGLGNFLNYADSRDINWLKAFRHQAQPLDGPDFPDWNVRTGVDARLRQMQYRHRRFQQAGQDLAKVLELLQSARPQVLPGARAELEYLVFKTESYRLHLEALGSLMTGHFAYDAAFRAKEAGDDAEMTRQFAETEARFTEAAAQFTGAAEQIATQAEHPDDRYILFRYNVRFVLPVRAFLTFIRNVANYHRGQPYWEKVDWEVIDPA